MGDGRRQLLKWFRAGQHACIHAGEETADALQENHYCIGMDQKSESGASHAISVPRLRLFGCDLRAVKTVRDFSISIGPFKAPS